MNSIISIFIKSVIILGKTSYVLIISYLLYDFLFSKQLNINNQSDEVFKSYFLATSVCCLFLFYLLTSFFDREDREYLIKDLHKLRYLVIYIIISLVMNLLIYFFVEFQ